MCDLSRKFGCDPEAVEELLRLAAELRIKIDGLSFHVGSQAAEPAMIVEAIERVPRAAAQRRRRPGTPAGMLDIGGGFPVEYLQPCHADRGLLRADPRGARGAAVRRSA